jgi:selenocysteine lyase/cysteine desulfurase
MITRRNFIGKSALLAGAMPLLNISNVFGNGSLKNKFERTSDKGALELSTDEDYWASVRSAYTVTRNMAYLNSGGVAPQPKQVQDAHIENYLQCNKGPAYYMWQVLDKGREPLREKLASIAGCSAEEISINRNSTEGLNTVIFGLNLKSGDEVVLNKYDYPNMMHAWEQRAKREGIKLNWIDMTFPANDESEMVSLYANAITSKTKIVHVTHLINWVGHILPARKIADVAHSKGCEVIIDGAHTFAHFDYKIPDLGADYFATSLHKWMGAPFGSGMLYIKKEKIKNVWALLSSGEPDGEDIRKFETLGTRSFASEMAIADAADFHLSIGAQRKEARLRYLKDYWCNKAKDIPGFKLYTSSLPQCSCAIATFSLDGWNAGDVVGKLMEKKQVFVTSIVFEKLNGIRVSPNVFTSLDELDRLVDGIQEIATKETPPPPKNDVTDAKAKK